MDRYPGTQVAVRAFSTVAPADLDRADRASALATASSIAFLNDVSRQRVVPLWAIASPTRRPRHARSPWRPTATPVGVGASRHGVGLLWPTLLLRQERGRQTRGAVASGADRDGAAGMPGTMR